MDLDIFLISKPLFYGILIIYRYFGFLQAYQIAHLIKDYTEEIQTRSCPTPKKSGARLSGVFFDHPDEELGDN